MLDVGNIIDGKYRIVRLLGEGGMGAVYEGENVRIARRVAIKVLHHGVAENKDAVERFEREAQAAGRIGNDHVLEVLDLGKLPSGEHFIVMEFLDGETLGERIEHRGRLTPVEVLPITRQALLGLRAAHQAGIIHRDLKPDNIFVCKEKAGQPDFVKIIDFGISKFNTLGGDMQMTRTGAVMGTPYYMSPEQARGSRDVDLRSDLYSMGVILYEALSGNKPFMAETFNALIFQIALADPAPLHQFVPDIDPAFASIVYKAMSREAAHRFQSTDEFIEALDQWSDAGRPVTVPPAIGHASAPGAAIPPAGAVPTETPAMTAATASAWANTGPQPAAPAKRRTGLVAAGVVAGLLVLGGVGLAGLHFMRSRAANASADAPGASASSAPSAAVAPPAESETAQPVAAPPKPEEEEPAPAASSAEPKPPAPSKVAQHPVARKTVTRLPRKTMVRTTAPKTTKPAAKKTPTTPAAPDFGY